VIATAKRRRKREKTLETAESNEAESSVDLQAARSLWYLFAAANERRIGEQLLRDLCSAERLYQTTLLAESTGHDLTSRAFQILEQATKRITQTNGSPVPSQHRRWNTCNP